MSWGMAICSKCHREVHQDGRVITTEYAGVKQQQTEWRHCDDKTPRCEGASSVYPTAIRPVLGKWCGRDGRPDDEG